jgi:MFS family permease
MNSTTPTRAWYLPFLILLSGMGGLLAGIDFGIIAGALLYLDKTIPMTPAQQGFMVAIYTFGGIIASLFAGTLADLLGRKRMMLAGGVMFVGSILLIFISNTYYPLLIGRVLMGLSGGVICVVVPLFMAECLPTAYRGRGTSAFQLLLTLGLVLATVISKYFAGVHEAAVTAAAGDSELIFKADQMAWKSIFLTACVPGALFIVLALIASESPRWLFRRKREEEAAEILGFTRDASQVSLEMTEMRERAVHPVDQESAKPSSSNDTLLQRKYVVPFVIACIVLACTQATGINTILPFGAKIIQGAGLSEKAAQDNLWLITTTNCVVTFFAALLVDRLGRKILLSIGTAGIIVCLTIGGLLFHGFESKRVDVLAAVTEGLSADGRSLSIKAGPGVAGGESAGSTPGQLSVTYKWERESKPRVVSAFSNAANEEDRILRIEPESEKKWVTVEGRKVEETRVKDAGRLEILRASYGPVAGESTGKWVLLLLCAFIAFFAFGPGVCVWLALTELMPTRIRSTGMGIAMVLNNGVAFLSALSFPVVVGSRGFHMMFFIWAAFTVVYFITATFFMPETKGRTLEEIEDHFAGKNR